MQFARQLRTGHAARYDKGAFTFAAPGTLTVPLNLARFRRIHNRCAPGWVRVLVASCAMLACAAFADGQSVTEPVGTTSPVQTATLTITTSGTIASINVLTKGAPNLDFNFMSGGTCAVGTTYSANTTCTVQYTFKPTAPGARYGGITLTSGNILLASTYISGTGTGPQVNFPPGILSKAATGFNQPGGMAFDGSGNLFVADNSDGRVMELIAATGYTTSTAIPTGITQPYIVALDGVGNLFYTDDFSVIELYAVGGYKASVTLDSFGYHPDSIAVDGNGNVFVTDNGNLIEILAAGGYSTIVTRPVGYFGCLGIDSSGNVFVASFYLSQMKEFFAASGYTTTNTFPLTVPYVASIAVDDNNNVFAIDNYDSTLRELFAASGYTTQAIFSLPSLPGVIALDATGNVFFSDENIRGVYKLDFADPPTLNFATTPVGQTSTDSPQTVTLLNSGNAPLIFSTPGAGINPNISAGFTLGNSSTCPELSASSAPATLAVGASCTNAVSFHPVAVGTPVRGSLTTADNALNATGATQIVPLGGNATPSATTATLTVSPNPATIGATVTLTANVAANPASTNIPTGTVTFYNGTTVLGIAPLANGIAVFSLSTLPAGNNNLSCVYSGDPNFATSICGPVVEDILITPTITFPQPASAYAGTSVLLTATASSGLPVTYTVVSGPANVSGSVLTYTGAGTVVVEADQAGNANYAAATPMRTNPITVSLVSEPVGTQSPVVTTLVTFSTQGAFTAINVLTQGAPNRDFAFASGGSCTIGMVYAAGQTCTVKFTFTPTRPGLRFGGITLTTAAAVTLANAYVYGLGTGPQVIYTPGTQSTFGSGYTYTSGVAVDSNGNAYVSDQGTNAVYEVPAGGGLQRSLGYFLAPDDVAVDGIGNVFVIYGQNRTSLAEIYAVNGVIPANPTVNVILTSLNGLNGMKVDGNGNVFLGAYSGGVSAVMEVLAVNGSIPANPTVLTLASNVGQPTGVAIDQSGDVYFSDQLGNAYEIYAVNGVIPANATPVSLASNLTQPSNIDLDAAGDVFVCESNAVIELVAVNGIVTPNTAQQVSIGTGLSFPQGMAIDASGNIYIADSGLPSAVKLDFSDAPSLTFATTPVGSTSTDSPQTIRFANGGNANLTFLPPTSGTNPAISSGFTYTSNCPVLAAGTALAYALTPGDACAESISFKPVTSGPDSGDLTLIDNNLNVTNSTQNIPLNALATVDATSLTVTGVPNPALALQAVTFTVHLTAVGGASVAGQAINLTYNATGTAPIVVPLTTDSTGTATYTVTASFNPGSYVVSVSMAATGALQAASNSVNEVVNFIPSTSVLTIAPNPPVVNTPVTLTATVTPSVPASVTGTVFFFNGVTSLGSSTVSSNGTATLTLAGLPLGSTTLTCAYSGNADIASSNCAPLTFTVYPPQDFSLTANPPSITIETQHHKTMQLTLTSIGLFSGPVNLSCGKLLPPYLTCELPGSVNVAANGTQTFNFTMDTDQILNFLAESRQPQQPSRPVDFKRVAFAMLLPLALAGFARKPKKLRALMLMGVLAIVATGLTACGDKWPQHTPPGVYTIPVVGTGVTSTGKIITHTLDITLTVTP